MLFVHSHIFKYDEQGIAYSEGKLTYNSWKRYLNHFDELVVAGRAENIKDKDIVNLNVSSGSNVKHYKLPSVSKIKNRFKLKRKLNNELTVLVKEADGIIARLPSIHASEAIKLAKKYKKPYAIELVGDVYTSLWYHGSVFGKVLAPISYIKIKKIIKEAPYVLYVTKNYLQEIYPAENARLTIDCSNVEINIENEIIEKRMCKIHEKKSTIKLGLIGSYSSKYKGIDTAIKSLKMLIEDGFNVELFILGSGNSNWIEKMVTDLKVTNKVHLCGSLPAGKEVNHWLDKIDIYIQPSLTEGLPRALIEAMSRGCPCVASNVGGIPELLDSNMIHEPNNVKSLSLKVKFLIENKDKLNEQSIRNYEESKYYSAENLANRRNYFWNSFKEKELL